MDEPNRYRIAKAAALQHGENARGEKMAIVSPEKKLPGRKLLIDRRGTGRTSAVHTCIEPRRNVDVTIYEKEKEGGGLMTYGIAGYKVTPQFCKDEVDYILSIGGITVKYEQELGKNISLDELRKNYDAVYIGFGVGLARQLDIPGEDSHGVVDAIRFIYELRNNGFSSVPVGDKVAVIGMGMTAIDAATQAKRLGAKEVTMLYRRTQEEMPCTETELNIAKLDGCKIVWLAAPLEVIVSEGKAIGLRAGLMKLGEPDASGRRSPVSTGEEFIVEADMIIKAAGQMPFEALVGNTGFENKGGKIAVSEKATTNIEGVFAGGDCVNGGREVVDAVQAGKDGAAEILRYLNV